MIGIKEKYDKKEDSFFYLLIYDVLDNKRRRKIVKILEGFGTRVQYSAFELNITFQQYKKMIQQINCIRDDEDNIRVYRMQRSQIILETQSLMGENLPWDIMIC